MSVRQQNSHRIHEWLKNSGAFGLPSLNVFFYLAVEHELALKSPVQSRTRDSTPLSLPLQYSFVFACAIGGYGDIGAQIERSSERQLNRVDSREHLREMISNIYMFSGVHAQWMRAEEIRHPCLTIRDSCAWRSNGDTHTADFS